LKVRFMNVYKYFSKYHFPNYSDDDFNQFYVDITDDFLKEFGQGHYDIRNVNIPKFKESVYSLIRTLYYLMLNSTNRCFNADFVWRTIYNNNIFPIVMIYFTQLGDESFLKLKNYFTINKKDAKGQVHAANVKESDDMLSFMGLAQNFTKDDLNKRYRQLAMIYHPDKGGSVANFLKLQKYKEILEKNMGV
jgi:hypothetical protein